MTISKNIDLKDFSSLRYKIFFSLVLVEVGLAVLVLPVTSCIMVSNYTMGVHMGTVQDCLRYVITMVCWVFIGGILLTPPFKPEPLNITLTNKQLMISKSNSTFVLNLKEICWTKTCIFNPLLLDFFFCGSVNKRGIIFLIPRHIKTIGFKVIFLPLTRSELVTTQDFLNSSECRKIRFPSFTTILFLFFPSIGIVLFSIIGCIFHSDITTILFSFLGYFIFMISSWYCCSYYLHSVPLPRRFNRR